MATTPTTLFEPILVANLPLPLGPAAELDSHWRTCGFTARGRAAVEEDFKLRHHYAGHFVVATAGPPAEMRLCDSHESASVCRTHGTSLTPKRSSWRR
jgi:hypothetical protein